jgi:hypothetical protein
VHHFLPPIAKKTITSAKEREKCPRIAKVSAKYFLQWESYVMKRDSHDLYLYKMFKA